MNYTPEQLRSEAAFIVAGSVVRHDSAWWRDQLRAHAAALEEIAELKAHAEAMHLSHSISSFDYKGAFAAYRRAYPKEGT